jgi:hypothetical protein
MSKKLQTLMFIGVLSISVAATFSSNANAQYSYLGSGWSFNTYTHNMQFKVPGNVVNDGTLVFVSDTVWYDNQVICKNKGGNISFSPGIGLISAGESASVNLRRQCTDRQSGGNCSQLVTYPNSVAELSDPELLAACRAAVGDDTLNAQQCFLRFYDLDGFISGQPFHCRNTNDTPIEIRTKGLCTTATAATCTDPTHPDTCTGQASQGVKFTFPNFNPAPNASFIATVDDASLVCANCVNGGSCPSPVP